MPRNMVPHGTRAVGIGIMVNGIATYAFLLLPARSDALSLADYAFFSTLWLATYFVGPGLYVPLEQEIGRLVAGSAERQRQGIESAGLGLLAGSSFGVGVIGLFFYRLIAGRLFGGDTTMVAVLVLGIVSTGTFGWAKGVYAGHQWFTNYGFLVGLEGLMRLAGVGVAVAVGATNPLWFALPIGVAPMAATALMLAFSNRRPAPRGSLSSATTRSMGAGVLVLAIAQLSAQFLMNGAPLALAYMADVSQQELVARLGAALVVARIPLFAYQAIQAALLPELARAAASGEWDVFRDKLMRVAALTGIGGSVAVVGGAALGPFVLGLAFGEEFVVEGRHFAALTASAILIVLALVAAQGMIAMAEHRIVALGWVLGVAAFIVALLPDADPIDRVLVAGLIGPLTSAAGLGWMVSSRLAARLAAPVTPR